MIIIVIKAYNILSLSYTSVQ